MALRPLLLPDLVEQRRQHETLIQQGATDVDQSFYCYTHNSSSSSDLDSRSPVTPTFSRSHSRYSGSTSSLEQLSSSYSESPVSPTQATNSIKGGKSLLPDVQEDPLREDEQSTVATEEESLGLYDCLCDEPCTHHAIEPTLSNNFAFIETDLDYYDLGCMSDSDFSVVDDRAKKQRSGDESAFAGLSRRVSSKISGQVSRWRSSSKHNNLNFSTTSEPALDHGFGLSRAASRAASSRSSSISAPGRYLPDRSNEPPLPPTPALSFYGSTEDVAPPEQDLDVGQPDVRKSLERERALAATPLLPPLLVERPPAFSAPPSVYAASPLQSPTVAAMSSLTLQDTSTPTPPLSSRPSVSSFRPALGVVTSPVSPMSELPSPLPNLIEHDEWSDLLGHANFTIVPRPYEPAAADMDALATLRSDWDLANVNYTKHLCRTGEHYGMTSNTYTLTQAKWAEIDREWRSVEAALIDRIVKEGNGVVTAEPRPRGRSASVQPALIPKMIEGKFPERGDVDIVGPMHRDEVMIRDSSRDVSPVEGDRKHVSVWLKSLAGKVGLRK